MKPQILKVNAPNRFVRVRGIPIRTPFELLIKTETEIKFMKNLLHAKGINDFIIMPAEDVKKETKKKVVVKPKTTTVTKSPEKKAETILEKIVESDE